MNQFGTDMLSLACILGGAAVAGVGTYGFVEAGADRAAIECVSVVEIGPREVVARGIGRDGVVVSPAVPGVTATRCGDLGQVHRVRPVDRVRVERTVRGEARAPRVLVRGQRVARPDRARAQEARARAGEARARADEVRARAGELRERVRRTELRPAELDALRALLEAEGIPLENTKFEFSFPDQAFEFDFDGLRDLELEIEGLENLGEQLEGLEELQLHLEGLDARIRTEVEGAIAAELSRRKVRRERPGGGSGS